MTDSDYVTFEVLKDYCAIRQKNIDDKFSNVTGWLEKLDKRQLGTIVGVAMVLIGVVGNLLISLALAAR